MTQGNPDPICKVCGGKKSEHEGRVHAFSEEEGRLETPEQQKKRLQPQGPWRPVVTSSTGQPDSAVRLAEVLAHKGIIDQADLLYVANLGPAPWLVDEMNGQLTLAEA